MEDKHLNAYTKKTRFVWATIKINAPSRLRGPSPAPPALVPVGGPLLSTARSIPPPVPLTSYASPPNQKALGLPRLAAALATERAAARRYRPAEVAERHQFARRIPPLVQQHIAPPYRTCYDTSTHAVRGVSSRRRLSHHWRDLLQHCHKDPQDLFDLADQVFIKVNEDVATLQL